MRDAFHLRPRILGYRKDGRPIYSIAGASPDDPSNNQPADPPQDPPSDPAPNDPPDDKTFTQADVDRIIAGRLSKFADYDDLKTKLAEVEQANQSESEKAINAAKDEGRKEARLEAAQEVALEAFNSAAGRRNPDYDTAPALELISLSKFVKDDGSVDRDAIKTAVERLVPEKEERKPAPSFGGGARKSGDTKPEATPGIGRLRSAYAETSK